MEGRSVYDFTTEKGPEMAGELLKRAAISLSEIDEFVFHQANASILRELAGAIRIPSERNQITLIEFGNTISSTVTIARWHADEGGKLNIGDTLVLLGFGVQYSWIWTISR
jgi:3-oxoacyl-[acyl-carrier-protein] synthase-3